MSACGCDFNALTMPVGDIINGLAQLAFPIKDIELKGADSLSAPGGSQSTSTIDSLSYWVSI